MVAGFGGDGFDCAMSQATDLAEGIPFFATSQNGVLGRGFYVQGAPFTQAGSFYDNCLVDLLDDESNLGGFYTCMNLYEKELEKAEARRAAKSASQN